MGNALKLLEQTQHGHQSERKNSRFAPLEFNMKAEKPPQAGVFPEYAAA
jgi:hypothetical protein